LVSAVLTNLEVVKLLSEVIMDLAAEIQQGVKRFDTSLSIEAIGKELLPKLLL